MGSNGELIRDQSTDSHLGFWHDSGLPFISLSHTNPAYFWELRLREALEKPRPHSVCIVWLTDNTYSIKDKMQRSKHIWKQVVQLPSPALCIMRWLCIDMPVGKHIFCTPCPSQSLVQGPRTATAQPWAQRPSSPGYNKCH